MRVRLPNHIKSSAQTRLVFNNGKARRFEEGKLNFEKVSGPTLVLRIRGLTGLQNPAFETNHGGDYAERDGNAFGPNFSPPIAVYLLNGP